VFWSYKQVAYSGDVVIQKRYFAIGDTRAPVTAKPLPFLFHMNIHPDKN
jgi:hypothetical protein